MSEWLVNDLKEVGLELNFKKTKVLHNHDVLEFNDVDFLDINGEIVQILHDDEFHS